MGSLREASLRQRASETLVVLVSNLASFLEQNMNRNLRNRIEPQELNRNHDETG